MLTETPSLLITDDDRGLRESLSLALQAKGFKPIEAENGEEALRIVREQTVHLVLLDMHMPRLTGLETLQQIRRFQMFLPCILMSAELDEQIVQQARLARVFSVLSKPLSLGQLTGVVRSALERTYDWHDQ